VAAPPEAVDELIQTGNLDAARAALAAVAPGDERYAVTRIRLSLAGERREL